MGFQKAWGCAVAVCLAALPVFGEQVPIEDKVVEIDIGDLRELVVSMNVIEGSLTVIGEDRPTVELEFEEIETDFPWGGTSPRVDFDAESGLLRVRVSPPADENDVIARVPRWVSVKLDTKDGDIDIENISGEIDAKTIDGNLKFLRVSGGIAAHSVDGEMHVELRDGRISGPVSLATIDGDITVIVSGELHAGLSVSTIDGGFSSNIEFTSNGSKGKSFWGGTNIEGVFGEGGPMLSLKTIDGDVEISRKD